MRKYVLLLGSAALGSKRILSITWKSSGEVTSVVRILSALHPDLIPRIDLRNSAQRQQKRERCFQLSCVASVFAQKAAVVMVADERHQHLRMRIKLVRAKNVDNPVDRVSLDDHRPQRVTQRKIKYRGHARIDAVILFLPAFEKRSDYRIRIRDLAYVIDVWIDLEHPRVPAAPELARRIRKSV